LGGLGAAVGLAVFFVLSAGDALSLPPLVMAWGGLAVGAVVLLAAGTLGLLDMRAPQVQVVLLNVETSWLVPLLGLALVAAAFAYVVGIVAARILGARLASFVGLSEVLFAVVFAWLLLDQVPLPVQLAGGVLVVAGIALVRYDELRGTARDVVGVG
jgi:drug/metabolite transporter (DMT)-like permease